MQQYARSGGTVGAGVHIWNSYQRPPLVDCRFVGDQKDAHTAAYTNDATSDSVIRMSVGQFEGGKLHRRGPYISSDSTPKCGQWPRSAPDYVTPVQKGESDSTVKCERFTAPAWLRSESPGGAVYVSNPHASQRSNLRVTDSQPNRLSSACIEAVPNMQHSFYADQVLDYSNGRVCPQRFKRAFMEVQRCAMREQEHRRKLLQRSQIRQQAHADNTSVMNVCSQVPGDKFSKTAQLDSLPDDDGLSEVSLEEVEEGEVDEFNIVGGDSGNVSSASWVSKNVNVMASTCKSNETEDKLNNANITDESGADDRGNVSVIGMDPRLARRAKQMDSAYKYGTPIGSICNDAAVSVSNDVEVLGRSFAFTPHEVVLPCLESVPVGMINGPVIKGKLPLLLDLDNTVLHAQAAAGSGYELDLSDWRDCDGMPELYKLELVNQREYYLKLRPQLRRFLRALSPYYEMSVYTNATQEYADLVVGIIDPDRTLFQDRIVARPAPKDKLDDKTEKTENKTVSCLYGDIDRRCVVAFDDRIDIWIDLPQSNLVKAQHYAFLETSKAELTSYYGSISSSNISEQKCTAPVAGVPAEKQKTLTQRPYDWDRHLDHMAALFIRAHKMFFEDLAKDPMRANIGTILMDIQRNVLKGVGIFLTGLQKSNRNEYMLDGKDKLKIPTDLEDRQIELAQRLGAVVYKQYDDPGVTHVVAAKNNTANVQSLKQDSQYQHLEIVHYLWLYSCEAIWKKAPEELFSGDTICTAFNNTPPEYPFKDHWVHLGGCQPTDIPLPALPIPKHESRKPYREFLGTGPYSDGAKFQSAHETVCILWKPDVQRLRQLRAC